MLRCQRYAYNLRQFCVPYASGKYHVVEYSIISCCGATVTVVPIVTDAPVVTNGSVHKS